MVSPQFFKELIVYHQQFIARISVSFFYVTALTLLMQHEPIQRLFTPLGSLGRMASREKKPKRIRLGFFLPIGH
ncbi:DUF418 domain-containing protein [Paenibacillus sp. sptzw28]|uniref:DUF418 domain-containing protein n=1 Tax=Paenibacillus sp. sptzw28 TaxID=715179 RepID=UPI001C6EAE50|nr:DUF418 domain-containing protein [Paenibacillus sp. sptzw28]QYR21452.1 DUF418 domain-containing protein [Paenibacillus sp. sptzw28]